MSIFATWLLFAEDGDEAAPLVYQGSHVNPADDHPRAGRLEIAAVPNHCHPGVRNHDVAAASALVAAEGLPVEYLRVSLVESPGTRPDGRPGQATVILDRAQVERLHATLAEWLGADER